MSYQSHLRKLIGAKRVDVTLASIGLIVSLSLLGLLFLAYDPLLVVVPLSTGTASALYLATANRRITEVNVPTLGRLATGYSPALVVFGLAGFVALVGLAGERTMAAYLLAGAVGTLILAQILLFDDERLNPTTILLQIVVVAVVVRLAGLFATPGYVGVDVWTHLPVFVQGIVDAGSFAGFDGSKYLMAPLYHSFAAIGTFLFGSPRTAVYLTLGLLIPISVLFVYGASTLLFPARWALLATALYAFSEHTIEWGMHIIPTSLGLVFFLAVLYCITRVFLRNAEGWAVALLALFSLAVVFTHQVSTAILLVFLGVSAAVALSTDVARGWPFAAGLSRKAVSLVTVFVGTTILTLVSWANTPFSTGSETPFLWRMIGTAQELFFEQAGFLNLVGGDEPAYASTGGTPLDLAVPYVELFGFALLLCIAVVGGLVMLRWDRPVDLTSTYLLTAAGLFVVAYGFSLFGFRVFLPGRWLAFLHAFMAIIGAMGVYYLFRTSSNRVILAVVLLLAVGYPASMLVTDEATMDSPAFPDQNKQFSYAESEIAAVHTISAIHPPTIDERISTDHPYSTIFSPLGGYDHQTLQVGPDTAISEHPVVYREHQSTGTVSFAVPGDLPRTKYTRTVSAGLVCPPERNVVYSNDQVRLCTQTGVTPEVGQ